MAVTCEVCGDSVSIPHQVADGRQVCSSCYRRITGIALLPGQTRPEARRVHRSGWSHARRRYLLCVIWICRACGVAIILGAAAAAGNSLYHSLMGVTTLVIIAGIAGLGATSVAVAEMLAEIFDSR